MSTRPRCPSCKSEEVIFKGFNESKTHRKCLCKKCKKYFKIGIFDTLMKDKNEDNCNIESLNISKIDDLECSKNYETISNKDESNNEITFLFDDVNGKVIEINHSLETVSNIISQKLVRIDDPDNAGRIVYKVSKEFDKKLATKS